MVSMIKARFRDHVRSKTDVAMKNEVLCEVLYSKYDNMLNCPL